MIRILAVAAAFLVMCIIIGISLHSIKKIDNSNQKVKDIEEGKQFAASITQPPQTTSIWEYLKNTTEPVTETIVEETEETLSESDLSQEEQSTEEAETVDATETTTQAPEETTVATSKTSSSGYILHLD